MKIMEMKEADNYRKDNCFYYEAGPCSEVIKVREKTLVYPDCRNCCRTFTLFQTQLRCSGIKNPLEFIGKYPCIPEDEKPSEEFHYIKVKAKEFVKNGVELFITSSKEQNGKTSRAIRFALSYIYSYKGFFSEDLLCYFINVPELLDNMKNVKYRDTEDFSKLKKIVKETNLIIWDGITDIYLTEKEQEFLYSVLIKLRNLYGKANIYTGKYYPNLSQRIGIHLANQLEKNCKVLKFETPKQKPLAISGIRQST